MTPANERKAQERKRKREAGLVPLEVWVPRDAAEAIKSMAERATKLHLLTRQGFNVDP